MNIHTCIDISMCVLHHMNIHTCIDIRMCVHGMTLLFLIIFNDVVNSLLIDNLSETFIISFVQNFLITVNS